jgi:hypothetical protein
MRNEESQKLFAVGCGVPSSLTWPLPEGEESEALTWPLPQGEESEALTWPLPEGEEKSRTQSTEQGVRRSKTPSASQGLRKSCLAKYQRQFEKVLPSEVSKAEGRRQKAEGRRKEGTENRARRTIATDH